LQPRYYSISSSSLVSSKRISVTAVVDSSTISGPDIPFKGVSTNYLLAMKNQVTGLPIDGATVPSPQTHQVCGPRDKYSDPTAMIHIRRSKFRLPRNPSTPVIMIGPGTGVAPFRGFVQERALQARGGKKIGRTILFYGCRKSDEDFLYKDEWETYSSSFTKGEFSLFTAFSREDPLRKIYVQDMIRSCADELKELILNQNAHVYVCGDASRMAKDVTRAIGEGIDGSVEGSSDAYLKNMKTEGRWSEDVW
jgi:NADPH-ferrihemoprotein reductase